MRSVSDWKKDIGMLCHKIKITDLAERDLKSIGDYIAFDLRSPETALNITQGLLSEIYKLRYYPKRCKLDETPKLAAWGIRKQYYKNYKIFYRVDDTREIVLVLRILHILSDNKAALYRMLE